MEYNTKYKPLKMAQYGRNIQMIAEQLINIKDSIKRNQYAEILVDIMANNHSHQKNNPEFKQKLWNDLYYLCDYKLEFNIPCTIKINEPEKLSKVILDYPENKINYRHYGRNIESMIRETSKLTDNTLKEKYILAIAAYMKLAYKTWNNDNVTDEQVIADLEKISGGKLAFDKSNRIINLVSRSYHKKPYKKYPSKNNKRRNYR